MPVDYAESAPEDRREFEHAFAALLTLQDLSVFSRFISPLEINLFYLEEARSLP
jgi:hypothetical protein